VTLTVIPIVGSSFYYLGQKLIVRIQLFLFKSVIIQTSWFDCSWPVWLLLRDT